jgi:hypothetical protein
LNWYKKKKKKKKKKKMEERVVEKHHSLHFHLEFYHHYIPYALKGWILHLATLYSFPSRFSSTLSFP